MNIYEEWTELCAEYGEEWMVRLFSGIQGYAAVRKSGNSYREICESIEDLEMLL